MTATAMPDQRISLALTPEDQELEKALFAAEQAGEALLERIEAERALKREKRDACGVAE